MISALKKLADKLNGTSGLVLFEEDVRNPAIEQLKKRTKLKVVKK